MYGPSEQPGPISEVKRLTDRGMHRPTDANLAMMVEPKAIAPTLRPLRLI